jgi:sporulation protein YlmC with PRC-barrel domain
MITKPAIVFSVIVGMMGAAWPLLAENTDNNDQQARDAALPHAAQRTPRPDAAAKASRILGREITDIQNKKIGTVRDLAVDVRNGRIVEVIVGTGGFLGIQERETAVPPEEFSWDAEGKKVVCRLDREELRNVPIFDLAHWEASVRPEKVREAYHRYRVTPYFMDETTEKQPKTEVKAAIQLTPAEMVTPQVPLGRIERASELMNKPVVGADDERLGRVENIILNLATGRVVVLIVSTGEYLDMGNEVSTIPIQALHYESRPEVFRLNMTREEMRVKPHYKPNEWPGVANPSRIAIIYNAYGLPTYRDFPDGDDSAENVRGEAAAADSDVAVSPADRAITARIRRGIMTRPDLSEDARYLTIITVDGQVTLRGPVRSKEEEQAIIEIARSAVTQNAKVTNQIQTIDRQR